jgi:hypothetical protein
MGRASGFFNHANPWHVKATVLGPIYAYFVGTLSGTFICTPGRFRLDFYIFIPQLPPNCAAKIIIVSIVLGL